MLAKKILEFRNAVGLLLPGNLVSQLGEDGLREALRRTWLEADTETGFLKISGRQAMIEEMLQESCGECQNCKKDPCECCERCGHHPCTCETVANESRNLVTEHTKRRLYEYVNPPGPGSGQPERGTGQIVQPQIDKTRSEEPVIGEDVVIADEGKSYQAKVASRNPDGSYKLSFGPNRPARERTFRKEEIQRVQPGDVSVSK